MNLIENKLIYLFLVLVSLKALGPAKILCWVSESSQSWSWSTFSDFRLRIKNGASSIRNLSWLTRSKDLSLRPNYALFSNTFLSL